MPRFDTRAEQLTVFRIEDEYLFAQYFEREDVFEALREYYDHDAYRFEIPADRFEQVRELLRDASYEPVVVDDLEPYCVVKEKYTEHADILRNSVVNWERPGHIFFLMKGGLAVREAVEHGATCIEDTDFVLGI